MMDLLITDVKTSSRKRPCLGHGRHGAMGEGYQKARIGGIVKVFLDAARRDSILKEETDAGPYSMSLICRIIVLGLLSKSYLCVDLN